MRSVVRERFVAIVAWQEAECEKMKSEMESDRVLRRGCLTDENTVQYGRGRSFLYGH